MAKKRSASSARGRRRAKSVRHTPDQLIDFSDIPESTDAELATARRVGRPKTGEAKQLIAFRIDPALLAKLRKLAAKRGRPYQTLLHEILESAGEKTASQTLSSGVLSDETFDDRLNRLRQVALSLLDAVESFRSPQPPRADPERSLTEEVKHFESALIRSALERTSGSPSRAARLLGLSHTTLNAKIKRYKISLVAGEAEAIKEGRGDEIAA